MKIFRFFFIIVLCSFCICLKGQTFDDAKSLYQEGRYAEALPVFKAEYENASNDASLNEWLGISLFKTGDLLSAEKHLAFAAQKKRTDASLYLGDLYAKTYRFEEAEKEFEKYRRAQRRNNEAIALLEEKIEYADKLRRAVRRTEDIPVIDSLIVPKRDFLSAYSLSASSGSIMPMKDFFKDASPDGGQTLYMNERQDKVYYAAGNDSTGYDLYSMEKLLNSFGNEKKLPASVNADGNQAYPFVMPDGVTLYFASTGHESLGGYDLYITRYNTASDSYLNPNQLNVPFNSPFNDYMMAIDEEKEIGWFATDRFQSPDSVCIYTFVPLKEVKLVESDDEAYVSRRAKITSIADTWKEGVDYASLRAKAKEQNTAEQGQGQKSDFSFVINDAVTYHRLEDFKNASARALLSKAIQLKQEQKRLQDELSARRDQFANGNESGTVRSSILALEKETESIRREIAQLEVQARNEEIRTTYQ